VFLGSRNASDGSYDIYGGSLGTYHVAPDADGVPAVTVRLGVDASVYSSKEKAPGTLLAQVTVESFARLAAGTRPQMESPRGAARARGDEAPRIAAQPPVPKGHRGPRRSAVIGLTVLAALSLVAWRLVRRRSSSW
jgi:hypothetical protein